MPRAAGCEDCLRIGGRWVHLRMCPQCGHVGCCDNSPNRHGIAHWKAEQHPIIRSFEPGEEWSRCYPDGLFFELADAPGAPSHPEPGRIGPSWPPTGTWNLMRSTEPTCRAGTVAAMAEPGIRESEIEWLNTGAAAKRLGITVRTLYRLINEDELPAYKFGRVIRLQKAEVDEFIRRSRIPAGSLEHLYPESRKDASDTDLSTT